MRAAKKMRVTVSTVDARPRLTASLTRPRTRWPLVSLGNGTWELVVPDVPLGFDPADERLAVAPPASRWIDVTYGETSSYQTDDEHFGQGALRSPEQPPQASRPVPEQNQHSRSAPLKVSLPSRQLVQAWRPSVQRSQSTRPLLEQTTHHWPLLDRTCLVLNRFSPVTA